MRFKTSTLKEPKHSELVSCVSWASPDDVISIADDHKVAELVTTYFLISNYQNAYSKLVLYGLLSSYDNKHAHNSYHHHDQHPLNHNHHRSQGQLIIDDAEILHQCLVSLAGERNVAMLLKRFQQSTQNNPLDDPESPC